MNFRSKVSISCMDFFKKNLGRGGGDRQKGRRAYQKQNQVHLYGCELGSVNLVLCKPSTIYIDVFYYIHICNIYTYIKKIACYIIIELFCLVVEFKSYLKQYLLKINLNPLIPEVESLHSSSSRPFWASLNLAHNSYCIIH